MDSVCTHCFAICHMKNCLINFILGNRGCGYGDYLIGWWGEFWSGNGIGDVSALERCFFQEVSPHIQSYFSHTMIGIHSGQVQVSFMVAVLLSEHSCPFVESNHTSLSGCFCHLLNCVCKIPLLQVFSCSTAYSLLILLLFSFT